VAFKTKRLATTPTNVGIVRSFLAILILVFVSASSFRLKRLSCIANVASGGGKILAVPWAVYSPISDGVSLIFGARRASLQENCNPITRSYRCAGMKQARAFFVLLFLSSCFPLLGGTTETQVEPVRSDFNPQRIEFSIESAYLLGAINAPASYEVGAEFLTGRIRWGVVDRDTWLRGYHQFYVSAMAEPIFRGIENYYFGFNLGFRYNFVPRRSRLVPYISGGVGGGCIDSHANIPGGQGQDFTFNILSAAGISYSVNDHWKLNVGALYQHLSNGGQTNPNPSLNLFGPQVGVTYSF
jgi:lipid A 3-O-deacylase